LVTWCFLFCKKNIQNTNIRFSVVFSSKNLAKNIFFVFSQRQTFKKCHILLHVHYTQVENHQFRVFLLHYFLLLFFRQRNSSTRCLFHGVCLWIKIVVVVVIFKHVQTCLLPWLILRKMHYKIRWTLEEVKRLTPKESRYFHPLNLFSSQGMKKILVEFLSRDFLTRETKKNDVWIPGMSNP